MSDQEQEKDQEKEQEESQHTAKKQRKVDIDDNSDSDSEIDRIQDKLNEKLKNQKDFMLLRIMGKVYCLNKDDIPEEGMLRTLYDGLRNEEMVVNIDQEFKLTVLIDFVFSIENAKKIYNIPLEKAYLRISEYIELVKICRFFQFSEVKEKEIMDNVELHWIYRYIFTSTSDSTSIFLGFMDNKEYLSISYKKDNFLSSFLRHIVHITKDEEIIEKYDAILSVTKNLIICKEKNNYFISERDVFFPLRKLTITPREYTYDPIINEFTFN